IKSFIWDKLLYCFYILYGLPNCVATFLYISSSCFDNGRIFFMASSKCFIVILGLDYIFLLPLDLDTFLCAPLKKALLLLMTRMQGQHQYIHRFYQQVALY